MIYWSVPVMTTNKPHDPELRAAIIAEMRRAKETGGYCTWWFKFHIPFETKVVRQELERMEREGLVTADRSRSNNTLWRLVEHDNK